MTEPLSPEELHPRVLAHLGDSVYELFIREKAIQACASHVEDLHRYTTQRANAQFQVQLLHALLPLLTEEEQERVRRARNVAVSSARRSNQALHRQSTGFEALIGFLYLTDQPRLQALWEAITPFVDHPEDLLPAPPTLPALEND